MGLMSSVMAGGPQEPPQRPPQGPAQPPGAPQMEMKPEAPEALQDEEGPITDSEATPEEQQEFDRAMVFIGRILYDQEGLVEFVAQIREADDPARELATVAMTVMKAADQRTQGLIPETMLVPIATETLGLIAEGAIKAGVPLDGAAVAQAAQYMVEDFMQEFGASPDEVEQLRSMIDTKSIGTEIDKVMSKGGGEQEDEPASEEESDDKEEPAGAAEDEGDQT